MMRTIIKNDSKEHFISAYKLKSLNLEPTNPEHLVPKDEPQSEMAASGEDGAASGVAGATAAAAATAASAAPNLASENVIEKSAQAEQIAKMSAINEEFLKKIDELSSNVVKLQMKLEKQESEFSERLANELEVARKNAFEEGKNAAASESDEKIAKLSNSIAASIEKLDLKASELDNFCKNAKKDLNQAAYLIAKEVVKIELGERSSQIALAYANSILSQMDEQNNVQISVNPGDYELLQARLASDKIKISADEAINKGCLVIHSDKLNTQISIQERLNQAKSMLFSE